MMKFLKVNPRVNDQKNCLVPFDRFHFPSVCATIWRGEGKGSRARGRRVIGGREEILGRKHVVGEKRSGKSGEVTGERGRECLSAGGWVGEISREGRVRETTGLTRVGKLSDMVGN